MRAAHSVVAKLIDEYMEASGATWKVGVLVVVIIIMIIIECLAFFVSS